MKNEIRWLEQKTSLSRKQIQNYDFYESIWLSWFQKIKSSLYLWYYFEACNEWRGPSPRHSAWATQKRRRCVEPLVTLSNLTGLEMEPVTIRVDGDVLNRYVDALFKLWLLPRFNATIKCMLQWLYYLVIVLSLKVRSTIRDMRQRDKSYNVSERRRFSRDCQTVA